MKILSRTEGVALVVSLNGRMDAVTAPEYEKKMVEFLEGGNAVFIIDFEALEYISSAGLRALLSTAKKVKALNGKLLLANIGGAVKEVFDISGFAKIFEFRDTVTDALESIG